jgi:hypothetical protein
MVRFRRNWRTKPQYIHVPPKVREDQVRRPRASIILNAAFFLIATLLAGWLALLLLTASWRIDWQHLLLLIPFWVVTAYLVLPRVHMMLAQIYVPGYFIGRARTSDGLLGDPINLAFDGTAKKVHQAMTKAGWTLADDVTFTSSWGIIVSSLFRRSYPAAPVSPLLVFGRIQCLAYQQEVEDNASQRHHVRLWRCPDGWLLPGGKRVDWIAAGTYDRSVGLSLFTLQVTHKIDANIDIERDYIVHSLQHANPEAKVTIVENFSTGYHSRNGGGDRVATDGHLPIVDLDAVALSPNLVIPEGVERAAYGYSRKEPGGPVEIDPDAVDDNYVPVLHRPVTLTAGVACVVLLALFSFRNDVVSAVGFFEGTMPFPWAWAAVVAAIPNAVLLVGCWFTWKGSNRTRLILMAFVLLEVFSDRHLISTNPSDIQYVLFKDTLPLNILALLALSSTSVQQWVYRRRTLVHGQY